VSATNSTDVVDTDRVAADRAGADRFDTDLDHHGPEFREHNYAIMADLQGRCPVAKSSAWDGYWLFTSYDAVFDACQDPELFSSHMAKAIPSAGNPAPFIPIDIDPPMLQKYRKLLLPYMSPKAAQRQEAELRDIATELIDAFIESGHGDLAQQLFTPLPARWVLRLLDFDETRWPEWIEWLHAMIHDRASNTAKAMEGVGHIYTEIATELAQRRANPGGAGILSALIDAEIDGAPLNDEELTGIVVLLLLGGMDTTAGLTGNVMLRIDAEPELRRQLIEDPSVLARATEEFLRHDTPTQGLTRIVTRDAEFHGRQLRKGDRVMLMFAAANRDPSAFDHPDDIDLERTANRHMSFALGVHRCLGSNFARLMFQVMITEVLRRMPDMRVSGTVERLPDAGDVYAVKNLPVSFTPSAPRG
jgi:cytochrome P450